VFLLQAIDFGIPHELAFEIRMIRFLNARLQPALVEQQLRKTFSPVDHPETASRLAHSVLQWLKLIF